MKENFFGKCLAYIYATEFQKRGLSHVHLLVYLDENSKLNTAEKIDKFITAEIPDPETDKELHDLILKHKIHGPCNERCQINGK